MLGGGLLALLPVAWLLMSGEPLGIDSTFEMVRGGVGLFAMDFLVFTAFVGLIGLVKRAAFYLEMARSAFPKESNFLQSLFAQYLMLLIAIVLLAWAGGWLNLNRPTKYLPRLAAIPVAIMLFAYYFRRFVQKK